MRKNSEFRRPYLSERLVLASACLGLMWAGILMAGCRSPQNTQAIQERTADLTAAAKRDAGAIAKGVAEGLARKGPLDINTASRKQLEALPGITPALARGIEAGRPYDDPRQLYKKHVLTKAQFNRIQSQVVAKQ